MSRTDHHTPDWVAALHAAEDGRATRVTHRYTCTEYEGTWRPTHVARRVDHATAEANGWAPATIDANTIADGWYRVPVVPHPCDVDTATGRCHRYAVTGRRHWRYWVPRPNRDEFTRDYYRPERAAVRDTLRTAVKEYRATGDTTVDPPTRQTRNSRWNGGYWD